MGTFIRNIFTVSVVSAVLGSGAGFAMAETSQAYVYPQSSAEVGYIGWNWWENSRPNSHNDVCSGNRVVAQFAETGPIAWDWWRHDHTHHQSELTAAVMPERASSNAEIGHVSWNWWQYPSSAGIGNMQQC